MRVVEYLEAGSCLILKGSTDARGLISQALDKLSLAPDWPAGTPPPGLVAPLVESLALSALGNGVALPHARLAGLRRPRLFLALLPAGLGIERGGPATAVSQAALKLVFLFLSPLEQTDTHLQMLAHLAWLAGRPGLVDACLAARSPDELLAVLRRAESSGQGGFVNLDRQSVFRELQTSPDGLSSAEAARRLAITGPNLLRQPPRSWPPARFLRNLVSVFALLLWVAGGLCFVPGVDMPQLGWAIFTVIIVNAAFAFWQERKAEKAIAALQALIPHQCLALRDGRKTSLPAADLVHGDIIFLEEGERIPVDARLIEAQELRVNNACLTGESRPIYKTDEPLPGDREGAFLWTELPNMVFAGTSVASGAAQAVVIGTGMGTEIGRIASLTQTVKASPSPLQREMKTLVNLLSALSLGIGLAFFLLGTLVGGLPVAAAFIFTIGITVANIPEGLLPTLSLSLAMGVQRMARRQVLVKHMPSVETLGSTTVICTDKTGTLTTNRISVVRLWAGSGEAELPAAPAGKVPPPELARLLETAVLCNNARPGLGDPTEAALLELADRFGMDWCLVQEQHPRLGSLPFESIRKRMSTWHREASGATLVCVKGSPLELLARCTRMLDGPVERPLVEADRAAVRARLDAMAAEGLRTLGFARKLLAPGATLPPPDADKEELESGLCFLGLSGMEDPPRPELSSALASCRSAGIRVAMITGDYGLTAWALARRSGLVPPGARAEDCLRTGAELEALDDAGLDALLAPARNLVFARMSPAQKMRVVKAFQRRGETVAVTGDGVNDAAALKQADIGIAMGGGVNDVAKEAAAMIVLDGNFASIVAAVEEGRAIYANIRRVATYILASNMPELAPFVLFVLCKLPLALTVMQILAIDLGTDLVPALGLGAEAPEPGIMRRPPRPRRERLINPWLAIRAYLWLGGLEIILSLAAFVWACLQRGWTWGQALPGSGPVYEAATTLTLAGIVACQIGNVFACRTTRQSIFRVGFLGNRLVLLGVLVELCLILLLVYLPFFQDSFGLAPLGLADWAFILAFPPLLLGLEELRKAYMRRRDCVRAAV